MLWRCHIVLLLLFENIAIRASRTPLDNYCLPTYADPYENYGIDLGTTELSSSELRFIAVGDWGIVDCTHDDCDANITRQLAAVLGDYADDLDPEFVISVGDHFYQDGIQSDNDSRWNTTFEDVFNQSSLTNIYWYGTLGNHDWNPNQDNYNAGLPNTTWDAGTNSQIYYTTSRNNRHKRWCLPSYYYTFSYQFMGLDTDKKRNTVRFIAIDTEVLYLCGNTNAADVSFCHGLSTPVVSQFWEWFYHTLDKARSNHEIVVVFTHMRLVSNGNYGLYNPDVSSKCSGALSHNDLLLNLSRILSEYEIPFYMAGHEHASGLFSGETDVDRYQLVHLLAGSFGKTDCHYCGGQHLIDEQYQNDTYKWSMIYGDVDPGFGAIVINNTHLDVKIIGFDHRVLAQYNIEFKNGKNNHETPSKFVYKHLAYASAIATVIIVIVGSSLLARRRRLKDERRPMGKKGTMSMIFLNEDTETSEASSR